MLRGQCSIGRRSAGWSFEFDSFSRFLVFRFTRRNGLENIRLVFSSSRRRRWSKMIDRRPDLEVIDVSQNGVRSNIVIVTVYSDMIFFVLHFFYFYLMMIRHGFLIFFFGNKGELITSCNVLFFSIISQSFWTNIWRKHDNIVLFSLIRKNIILIFIRNNIWG